MTRDKGPLAAGSSLLDLPLNEVERRRQLDLAVDGEERREPAARMRELAQRALPVAVACLVAGGGEVVETAHELSLAQREHVFERVRGRRVLASLEMPLGAPERGGQASVRRRPVELVVHAREHRTGLDRAGAAV
jgi:hypothetical protein